MSELSERVLTFVESAPTVQRFLTEWGQEGQYLQGPYGSSKTLGMVTKLVLHGRAMAERPLPKELWGPLGRKVGLDSRYLVVRRHWEELKTTTLVTFLRWYEGAGRWVQSNRVFSLEVPNGRSCELLWMGLDEQGALDKVNSLDITGFGIDEGSETIQEVWMRLKGRAKRYPEIPDKRKHSYLLLDVPRLVVSNPPGDEHWLVDLFERTPPPGYRQYIQPSGLSPNAENLANLPDGYYRSLMADYASRPDLQARYVRGERAVLVKGAPVYGPQWDRSALVTDEPQKRPEDAKLLRGWDASGNVPAALVGWMNPDGCWIIEKEFVTDRAGILEFAEPLVEWCALNHPGAEAIDVGDPASFNEFSAPDGGLTSNALILEKKLKIKMLKGIQKFSLRRDALGDRMTRRNRLRIYGPGCSRLVSGLAGGYAYPLLPDGRGYGDEPIKNQFSHPVEAAQYLATYAAGMVEKMESPPPVVRMKRRFQSQPGAWMGA